MARISPAAPEQFAQVADYMDRWNITLATRIEDAALAFAEKHLAPSGWTAGAHGHTIPDSPGKKR